ncbi:PREDICTED: ATP-dependent Clp protease adapter protein ClpS-like isoform X1 [Brassica oleracea var. oleracea]|uniref:ATP-dependent Clp protease adapter protein ClpS-like isoform X1 n=1 Tax=Brassica oleracea var. oleracea TaxID=109376 RepID=UPI0006A6EAD6|nr:PREDICTED: ATP-dependent Clp protease adapter protein ClpS-like isoform X1 [Brassica oleracea var. oleracea]
METAICGRLALAPTTLFNSISGSSLSPLCGDKHSVSKGPCVNNRGVLMTMSTYAALGKGGGVLDKPIIEKTTPGRESEFDLRKSKKMAPPYRVILHNDNFNKREYVVQVLMKVIPGMTVDNAVNIMQEAHINGLAVVIVCAQADAEQHCMQLRGNGLLSSVEPDGGGC